MTEKILLKDLLFNREKVARIASEIHRAYSFFGEKDFVRDVVARLPELELKARISWIAECLKSHLPDDYPRAVAILLDALPAPNNPDLSDGDFGDFIYAPYAEYVARNGCTRPHLRMSLGALRAITQRFSVEDAIRYFFNGFPQETLKELSSWTADAHYHVRRLCSEGTRPRLPWSQKINVPIAAPLPILDRLFSDRTRFVTRSVANHLNDISRTDPALTMDTLRKWRTSGKQSPDEMDYILRHALRTLVKQGNPKAMHMLGYAHGARVNMSRLLVPKQVRMNTTLDFSFSLKALEDTNIIVDYTIYFQNKSGKLGSRKVFKLAKLALAKNKPATVAKRHMLRERMTTRTLYPGKHELEIQVNGKPLARRPFRLK
jgi:3-methyladenine DNA glycosylase AlkC